MENKAREMQSRIEAVLDEAIACNLLSGASRPWLLKWFMVALTGEEVIETRDSAPPTLEEVIEDCIAHQDLRQSERLRNTICDDPGLGTLKRAALWKRLNDGFGISLGFRPGMVSNV